jgi:hypothetical protein
VHGHFPCRLVTGTARTTVTAAATAGTPGEGHSEDATQRGILPPQHMPPAPAPGPVSVRHHTCPHKVKRPDPAPFTSVHTGPTAATTAACTVIITPAHATAASAGAAAAAAPAAPSAGRGGDNGCTFRPRRQPGITGVGGQHPPQRVTVGTGPQHRRTQRSTRTPQPSQSHCVPEPRDVQQQGSRQEGQHPVLLGDDY